MWKTAKIKDMKDMKKAGIFAFLMLLGLAAADVTSGKILRFVDENGVTHYTDDEAQAQGYEYDEFDDLGQPDPDNVVFRLDTETNRLYTNREAIDSDVLFDTPLEIPGNTEYYLGYLEVFSDEEVSITSSFDIGSLYMKFCQWNGGGFTMDEFRHVVEMNNLADKLVNDGIDAIR